MNIRTLYEATAREHLRSNGIYPPTEATMNEATKNAFLVELRELTMKYGIAVAGCDCCDSPWLDEQADITDARAGYAKTSGFGIRWVAPSDKYGFEINSDFIVFEGARL